MGGNAFKNLNIVRMNNAEFNLAVKKITKVLKKELGTDMVDVLPFYTKKPSFSDIDLMLCTEDIENFEKKHDVSFYEHVNDLFDGGGIAVNNDQLVSIAIPLNKERTKFVQLDLMPHLKNEYTKDLIFFAYNDLNILINRFISIPVFGGKYVPDGVSLNIHRDENSNSMLLGTIKTTNKALQYLDFLGLDIDKFKKGFDTKQDLFDFVIESKYFSTETFHKQIGIDNNMERVRRERDLYSSFIEYVEKNAPFKQATILADCQELLFEQFPELKEQKKQCYEDYSEYLKLKNRFNVEYISSIVGQSKQNQMVGKIFKSVFPNRNIYLNKEVIYKINRMTDDELKELVLQKRNEINEREKPNIKSKKRIF